VFEESPGTFGLAYHAYVRTDGYSVSGNGVGYPNSRLFFTAKIDMSTGHPVIVDG
jgi:hypothetical protein